MVMSIPETVFEEKYFDYLYSFITNPKKAVETERALLLKASQQDDSNADKDTATQIFPMLN